MLKPFVLILGSPTDPVAALTREAVLARGRDVQSFAAGELMTTVGLNWCIDSPGGSFLTIVDTRVPFDALTGVLVRLRTEPLPDPRSTPQEQQYIFAERQATLYALLHSLECRVINRPPRGVAHRIVAATVERAAEIRAAGFRPPRVLVASVAGEAAAFWEACGDRLLYRSPTGWQGWRLAAGQDARDELEAVLARQPLYLQELPAGEWLRVFTVGQRLFGAAGGLAAGADAGAPRPLHPVRLSAELEERCRRLALLVELEFAQIDLIRTAAGDLYCLDVSGWPEVEGCGPELQVMLAEALADRLTETEQRESDDPGLWRAGRHGDGVRLLAPAVPAP